MLGNVRPPKSGKGFQRSFAAWRRAERMLVAAGILVAPTSKLFGSSGVTPDSLTVVAVLQDEMALAGAHDIEVRDSLAYVAGKGGTLAIVDVSEPSEPSLLWSTQDALTYEDAEAVLPLDGNRLLVGARELLLFDIRQPAKPALLATAKERPRIDRINGFARHGNTVFCANKSGFIVVADVSAPDKIRLLGIRAARERDDLFTPHAVALSGDFLVVTDGRKFGRDSKPGQIAVYRVIDASTREPLSPEQWTAPKIIRDLRFAGANRVMTGGKFAYVGSSLAAESPRHTGLQNNVSIVDLTDPMSPRLRGSIAFSEGRGPNGMEVSRNVVFRGRWPDGAGHRRVGSGSPPRTRVRHRACGLHGWCRRWARPRLPRWTARRGRDRVK